jgi:hypothetical protein
MTWETSLVGSKVSLELKGATAHYSGYAPAWLKLSEPIEASRVTVEFMLPDEIAPGLYVLECRVRYHDEDLPAFSDSGREMSPIALQPIQIVGNRAASGDEPILGRYGLERETAFFSLVGVNSERPSDRRLQASLTWRSERQAARNYRLSLRLLDADGAPIVTRDLPPLLGGYPTSLWRPGELITDRVMLKLPKETYFSGDERLEVVLYDRLTLQAIGTTRTGLNPP